MISTIVFIAFLQGRHIGLDYRREKQGTNGILYFNITLKRLFKDLEQSLAAGHCAERKRRIANAEKVGKRKTARMRYE